MGLSSISTKLATLILYSKVYTTEFVIVAKKVYGQFLEICMQENAEARIKDSWEMRGGWG